MILDSIDEGFNNNAKRNLKLVSTNYTSFRFIFGLSFFFEILNFERHNIYFNISGVATVLNPTCSEDESLLVPILEDTL